MIRLLRETDDPSGFSCGSPELDTYLQRHAILNATKGVSITYVDTRQNDSLLGFITLAGTSVKACDIGENDLPRYPLPALLVARLAVDIRFQHRGIGKHLLRFAFEEAVVLRGRTGCVGVVVDAVPEAIEFYRQLGFIELSPSASHTTRMFLSMGTLIDSLI